MSHKDSSPQVVKPNSKEKSPTDALQHREELNAKIATFNAKINEGGLSLPQQQELWQKTFGSGKLHDDPSQKQDPTRYLETEQFHVLPISGLSPDELKSSVKKMKKDREEIKVTTSLNLISKRLGFKEGFSGYRSHYPELSSFMAKNELLINADLVKARYRGVFTRQNRQQVAEYLFSTNMMPTKIFTGYDLGDWFNNYPYDISFLGIEVFFEELLGSLKNPKTENQKKLAETVTRIGRRESFRNLFLSYKDAVLNYLGDTLSSFNNGTSPEDFICNAKIVNLSDSCSGGMKVVPGLYFPEDQNIDVDAAYEKCLNIAKILRLWINQQKRGWVEVIPYNDSLIFLKGANGEYDFVFKGLRDKEFDHNIYEPYLKNYDIPKSNDEYHFKRWLYFNWSGRLEVIEHLSEQFFYNTGKSMTEYPGQTLLKDYLTSIGAYQPPVKVAGPHNGFEVVQLNDGKRLYISEMVSIKEFFTFLNENHSYLKYRPECDNDMDSILGVNGLESMLSPASVTWYDATAYTAWFSKKNNLPCRLLDPEEYLEVIPPVEEHSIEDLYQTIDCNEKPRWKLSPNNLSFLNMFRFGEWLNGKGLAVNPMTGKALLQPKVDAKMYQCCAHSTNGYKLFKTGFRLCYLAE